MSVSSTDPNQKYAQIVRDGNPWHGEEEANRNINMFKKQNEMAEGYAKKFREMAESQSDKQMKDILKENENQYRREMIQREQAIDSLEPNIKTYQKLQADMEAVYNSVGNRSESVKKFIDHYLGNFKELVGEEKLKNLKKAAEVYLESAEGKKLSDAMDGAKTAKEFSAYVSELMLYIDRRVSMPVLGLNPESRDDVGRYKMLQKTALGDYHSLTQERAPR